MFVTERFTAKKSSLPMSSMLLSRIQLLRTWCIHPFHLIHNIVSPSLLGSIRLARTNKTTTGRDGKPVEKKKQCINLAHLRNTYTLFELLACVITIIQCSVNKPSLRKKADIQTSVDTTRRLGSCVLAAYPKITEHPWSIP